MDFTRFMNKFNDFEKQLSPTSALKLSFDNITPESDEPPEGKKFWGVPVPEFVSEWIEDEFADPPIFYDGIPVLRKVRRLCNRDDFLLTCVLVSDFRWKTYG